MSSQWRSVIPKRAKRMPYIKRSALGKPDVKTTARIATLTEASKLAGQGKCPVSIPFSLNVLGPDKSTKLKLKSLAKQNGNFLKQVRIAKSNVLKMDYWLSNHSAIQIDNEFYPHLFHDEEGEVLSNLIAVLLAYDLQGEVHEVINTGKVSPQFAMDRFYEWLARDSLPKPFEKFRGDFVAIVGTIDKYKKRNLLKSSKENPTPTMKQARSLATTTCCTYQRNRKPPKILNQRMNLKTSRLLSKRPRNTSSISSRFS